jgi:hypothetical protein
MDKQTDTKTDRLVEGEQMDRETGGQIERRTN